MGAPSTEYEVELDEAIIKLIRNGGPLHRQLPPPGRPSTSIETQTAQRLRVTLRTIEGAFCRLSGAGTIVFRRNLDGELTEVSLPPTGVMPTNSLQDRSTCGKSPRPSIHWALWDACDIRIGGRGFCKQNARDLLAGLGYSEAQRSIALQNLRKTDDYRAYRGYEISHPLLALILSRTPMRAAKFGRPADRDLVLALAAELTMAPVDIAKAVVRFVQAKQLVTRYEHGRLIFIDRAPANQLPKKTRQTTLVQLSRAWRVIGEASIDGVCRQPLRPLLLDAGFGRESRHLQRLLTSSGAVVRVGGTDLKPVYRVLSPRKVTVRMYNQAMAGLNQYTHDHRHTTRHSGTIVRKQALYRRQFAEWEEKARAVLLVSVDKDGTCRTPAIKLLTSKVPELTERRAKKVLRELISTGEYRTNYTGGFAYKPATRAPKKTTQ